MRILFIEDDEIETMKMKRTLSRHSIQHELIEAKNGEEALDFLKSDALYPDYILLDLNMPKLSGIEFLRILKADDQLKYLPTIILTTSENRVDLLECYKIGIAGYILKPLKYADYEHNLKRVIEYWEVNQLIKANE